MARKPKDDTPAGGWIGPDSGPAARARKPIAIANGTKLVDGKLVWKWKSVGADYVAPEPDNPAPKPVQPAVRIRTRPAPNSA